MGDKPLVSVIIIFLNAERFIDEAIESVFGQTYKNWELSLVDDGSGDSSSEIALRYAEQCPERVRYLKHADHQNRGTSASRNLGIRHSTGEYVAFLDADDVWLPHKLERQVAILNAHPEAAMVYGSPQLWHGWTKNPQDIQYDSLQDIGVRPNILVQPPTLLALFLAKKAITPAPSDVLLRHQIVKQVGGFEDSFRGLYEDQVLFAKICLKAPVFVSDECWDRHRQHRDSVCSVGRTTGEYYSGYPRLLTWTEAYLSEQGFRRTQVWKVLQRALLPYRHPILYRALEHTRECLEQTKDLASRIMRQTLPAPAHRWLQARWHRLQGNKV